MLASDRPVLISKRPFEVRSPQAIAPKWRVQTVLYCIQVAFLLVLALCLWGSIHFCTGCLDVTSRSCQPPQVPWRSESTGLGRATGTLIQPPPSNIFIVHCPNFSRQSTVRLRLGLLYVHWPQPIHQVSLAAEIFSRESTGGRDVSTGLGANRV
jgi:hypothetical protein